MTHFITRATKENIPQYTQKRRHKGLGSKAKSDSCIGARFCRKPPHSVNIPTQVKSKVKTETVAFAHRRLQKLTSSS